MRRYRDTTIEDLTAQRLREYCKISEKEITPPIPIDKIIEQQFDLRIGWEEIPELKGEKILGAIYYRQKTIILNENHRKELEEKPGLERFTLGHELGHWDLFCDKGKLDALTLPGLGLENGQGKPALREGKLGLYEVIIKNAWTDDADFKKLMAIMNRKDGFFEAHAVNTYASTMLLPIDLLKESCRGKRLDNWPELYRLAEEYGVTITALKVRLSKLGHLHIGKNGSIRRGKETESRGQNRIL